MKMGRNGTSRMFGLFPSKADRARDAARAAIFDQVASVAGGALAVGGYDNARPSRLRKNSNGSSIRGGSADSHRDPLTRDNLRKSCQDLDRNNVLARGLVQRLTDMVVGDGFSLQVQTGDPDWNARAERLFCHWAGTAYDAEFADVPQIDIRGASSIDDFAAEIIRSACVDGDIGFVLTNVGQVQAIEAERITNPGGMVIDGMVSTAQTMIVGGVEMTAAGMPVRFWVSTWSHIGAGSMPTATPVPVPAEAFVFLSNPLRRITGATRGEPQLQAAAARFEHLDNIDEAARIAMFMQACLAALIVTDRPDAMQSMAPGATHTTTNEDGDSEDQKREEIEPGMIKYLPTGTDVKTITPSQPGPQYDTFVLLQIIQICADIGLPLPLALLDGRQVNLSSIRCVLQFAWRNFERWQEWLRCKFYARLYRWRIAMFIREGYLPYREDWSKHTWDAPPPPVMDPGAEVNAARAMVDARFSSYESQMKKRWGINPKTEFPKIAAEQETMRQLGITPMSAPGTTGMPQAAKNPADDKTAPPTDPNADPSADPAEPADDPAADPNAEPADQGN